MLNATAAMGAASQPASSPDGRDLSGVYLKQAATNGKDAVAQLHLSPIEGSEIPLRPEARALWQERKDGDATGHPIRRPTAECLPPGVVQGFDGAAPFQIIQTPGQVTIIAEYMRQVRQIYMDEKQPAKVPLSFMGHSVGRWDGDTLVIDTIGQRH